MAIVYFKVFIPCAGVGSRARAETGEYINKALVAVNHKPVISFIVDKFPADIEIVVALGHKGESIRDFLLLSYPERRFTFVDVDPYEGEGSGKGRTLLSCEEHLQCPFIFIANDTIIEGKIPGCDHDWVGAYESKDVTQYRTLLIKDGFLIDIMGNRSQDTIYTGVAGIKSYDLFWDYLNRGSNRGSIEEGECYGINSLLADKMIKVHYLDWHDVGNEEAIARTRKVFYDENSPKILDKDGEFIWFSNGKVIKYSSDTNFITNRVKRGLLLGDYVPSVLDSTDHMYVYNIEPGDRMSTNASPTEMISLLNWLSSFWKKEELNKEEESNFHGVCMQFYRDKTYQRVEDYFSRFGETDSESIINGSMVAKTIDMLDALDWEWLSKGVATRFHGDLHLENILADRRGSVPYFKLLDWRQDFGGLLKYGDIYYDFAKLRHGLIVSDELMSEGHYSVKRDQGAVIDLLRRHIFIEMESMLQSYIESHGYDYEKVRVLTAIVYLNMSALHENPYAHFLYCLGRYLLCT